MGIRNRIEKALAEKNLILPKKKKKNVDRRIEAARIMQDAFQELDMPEEAKKAADVAKKLERVYKKPDEYADLMREANDTLKDLQNKKINRYLKELYIKKLLPEAYDREKQKPVEDKVLFLQTRKGLNLSCKYLHDTLVAQGKYTVRLHSLNVRRISNAESYLNAMEFIKDMGTAKAVFTHTFHDYYDYLDVREETKVVQLWHGCGIIKKLGVSNADNPGRRTREEFREFNSYKNYDLVVMPSEEERWVFEDMMGLEKGDPVLQAIGVSRTDEFFDPAYKQNCYDMIHKAIPATKEKKTILYAPTYRGPDSNRYSPDALDVGKFAEALGDEYILIIKHHGTAKTVPEIPAEYNQSFAFNMTGHPDLGINELMCVCDMIISDYSSVVFEFSLMERPIIFFMFDLEDYRDSHGMYYTYEEIAECGPIFKTNEEMIDYIQHIDERFDKQKVIDFKNRFMSACDGHSTERIIAFIES